MRQQRWQLSWVCIVLITLLSPAVRALDFSGGGEFTVDYALPAGDFLHQILDATVNFQDGSSLPDGNWLITADGCVANIYDCVFGAGSLLLVTVGPDAPYAFDNIVTFYGTEFAVNGAPVDSATNEIFLPNDTLSGLNANGEYFEVAVQCYEEYGPDNIPVHTTVKLGWLGGPSVIEVYIDIKPDSSENTVNLGSMGVIPVGILSTTDFDATQVDPWTVELAGAGVAVRGKGSKLLSQAKDLNGDGLLDLEVKVETENLDPGQFQDGNAVLTGQTYDGLEIEGTDFITIVPAE